MPAPPDDIRTIDTLEGTRFVLPSHPLLRVVGVFPLTFGLAFSGFAAFWILGAAGVLGGGAGGAARGGVQGVLSLLFPLFGVPFLIVGLVPIAMGVTLIFGRPEFEIRDDRFRAGPRLGPLRRSKWRQIDDLERLEINRFGSSGTSPMHVLRAHVGDERPLNITGSRDRAWLEQLARAITGSLGRDQLIGDPPGIVVRERDPDLEEDDKQPEIVPPGIEDPGPAPAGSRLWAEDSPTGRTIFIPPRGLRGKPVPALLTFAIFWLGITNVVGAGFVVAFARGTHAAGAVFAALFIVSFEAIGVGMLLYTLSLARRRAILDVTDDGRTLLVTRSGLRASSQREIPAASITDIRVQNSGTSINDRPLRQVIIRVADAADVDVLTGASEPELTWLAHTLRHALTAPDTPPAPPRIP